MCCVLTRPDEDTTGSQQTGEFGQVGPIDRCPDVDPIESKRTFPFGGIHGERIPVHVLHLWQPFVVRFPPALDSLFGMFDHVLFDLDTVTGGRRSEDGGHHTGQVSASRTNVEEGCGRVWTELQGL